MAMTPKVNRLGLCFSSNRSFTSRIPLSRWQWQFKVIHDTRRSVTFEGQKQFIAQEKETTAVTITRSDFNQFDVSPAFSIMFNKTRVRTAFIQQKISNDDKIRLKRRSIRRFGMTDFAVFRTAYIDNFAGVIDST